MLDIMKSRDPNQHGMHGCGQHLFELENQILDSCEQHDAERCLQACRDGQKQQRDRVV